MWKKKLKTALFACGAAILLSGCSISTLTGAGEEVVEITATITKGEGEVISLPDGSITLPDGWQWAWKEGEGCNAYYAWYIEDDVSSESDPNISLYIYEGMDTASPDYTLTSTQTRTTLKTFSSYFTSDVDGNLNVGYTITTLDDWYAMPTTGFSGDYISATYGNYYYPKYYYGVLACQRYSEDYTRQWYVVVFSNDGYGEVMSVDDYNSLRSQICDLFAITVLDTDSGNEEFYSYESFSALCADAAYNYGLQHVGEDEVTEIEDTGNVEEPAEGSIEEGGGE